MSWRNTLLLAIAVALVGSVAYRDVIAEDPDAGWSAVFVEPQPTVPADDIERLLDLEPEAVVAVSIEYKDAKSGSRRTAQGWSGTSAPRAVNEFLDSLAELAIILVVNQDPTPTDLEGYGLVEPIAQIALELDRLPPISIALGQHNPSATGIYARVSQRPVVALTGAVALWDLQQAVLALSGDTPDGSG